jgi:hypothetical protein
MKSMVCTLLNEKYMRTSHCAILGLNRQKGGASGEQ